MGNTEFQSVGGTHGSARYKQAAGVRAMRLSRRPPAASKMLLCGDKPRDRAIVLVAGDLLDFLLGKRDAEYLAVLAQLRQVAVIGATAVAQAIALRVEGDTPNSSQMAARMEARDTSRRPA